MHRPILVLPAGAFNIQHVVLKASFRNAPLRRAVQRKCADSEITRARHDSSMAPKMGPRCHKIAPRWSHSFDSNQQQVSPPQPGASPAMPDSSSTAPAAPEHVQPIAWSYLKDNLVPRLWKKVPLVRRRETSIRAWPRRDEHTRAARADTSIRAEVLQRRAYARSSRGHEHTRGARAETRICAELAQR